MATYSAMRSEAEDHLLQVLHLVNEWLRFAETKNAGMLAFSGVSIGALLSYASQVEKFNSKWGVGWMVVGGALWIVTVFITSVSFLPKSDRLNILSGFEDKPEDSDNLYYFGDIAKYAPTDLLNVLGGGTDQTSDRSKYELDLAEQVVINSRIANGKMRAFQLATKFWLFGIIPVVIGIGLTFWNRS